jgi:hypothetical protein
VNEITNGNSEKKDKRKGHDSGKEKGRSYNACSLLNASICIK